VISQTDLQCTWNIHKQALQLYAPRPRKKHPYFKVNCPCNILTPSQENISKIQQILLSRNENSALFLR